MITNRNLVWVLAVVFSVLFSTFIIFEVVLSIKFDVNVEGRLKRAADSNSVEFAKKELSYVIEYLEANKLTQGYTSIVYKTPDEDINFWYTNLTESLNQLNNLHRDTSNLEKSNILIKLRETLLDTGKEGVIVTIPSGLYIYPYNLGFALWGFISGLLAGYLWIILFLE